MDHLDKVDDQEILNEIAELREDLNKLGENFGELSRRLIGDYDNPGGILVVVRDTQEKVLGLTVEVETAKNRIAVLESQINNFRDTTVKFFVKLILTGLGVGVAGTAGSNWIMEIIKNMQ